MRVLFSILDWGLGHATRSSVLINELARMGIKPILASSGKAMEYLQLRFPNLDTIEMPDKTIRYGKRGASWSIAKRALQQHVINAAQRKWTQSQIEHQGITHVISDNVYGAHGAAKSAIITHQLGLMAPMGKKMLDKELAKWLAFFDEIWVPDIEGEYSLAGDLLHNPHLKKEPIFLGHLSRFSYIKTSETDIPYLAILSGPEPQRSQLESELVKAFAQTPKQLTIVRGTSTQNEVPSDFSSYDILTEHELGRLIERCENIICRSGYSSLMDYACLAKGLCVIPTPQQPEQKYLANRIEHKGWFGVTSQNKLELHFKSQYRTLEENGFKNILERFLT